MSRSAAPRRAAPPQRVSFLLEIHAVTARTAALMQREFAREGAAIEDYATLSAIGAFGPLRLTELSAMLGTPLTTTSDSVRRLVARKQVRRRANPHDGRSKLLELTAAGDRAWRKAWPALQRATAAIRRELDVPEDEVRDALRRLEAALGAALTDD